MGSRFHANQTDRSELRSQSLPLYEMDIALQHPMANRRPHCWGHRRSRCGTAEHGIRQACHAPGTVWPLLVFHGRLDLLVLCDCQRYHDWPCSSLVDSGWECYRRGSQETPERGASCYCFCARDHCRSDCLLHWTYSLWLDRRLHPTNSDLGVYDRLGDQYCRWAGPHVDGHYGLQYSCADLSRCHRYLETPRTNKGRRSTGPHSTRLALFDPIRMHTVRKAISQPIQALFLLVDPANGFCHPPLSSDQLAGQPTSSGRRIAEEAQAVVRHSFYCSQRIPK